MPKQKEKKSKKNKKKTKSEGVEPPPAALPAEKIDWCWFFNSGERGGRGCQNPKCNFDHRRVSDAVFKKTSAPTRTRSNSPAARTPATPGKGRGKGDGKNDGKGRGKGDAKNREPSLKKDYKKAGAFRTVDGKKVPYFCEKYLKGECPHQKNAKDCRYRHMTQARIDRETQSLNTV